MYKQKLLRKIVSFELFFKSFRKLLQFHRKYFEFYHKPLQKLFKNFSNKSFIKKSAHKSLKLIQGEQNKTLGFSAFQRKRASKS